MNKQQFLNHHTVSDLGLLVLCVVDDHIDMLQEKGKLKLSNHPHQKCSLAELLTIAILGEFFVQKYLGHWYAFVKKEYPDLFPNLPCVTRFYRTIRKAQNLLADIALIVNDRVADEYQVIDSMPVPICEPIRSGRPRAMTEHAIGSSGKGFFCGFKLHAIVNPIGQFKAWCLCAANHHDAKVANMLLDGPNGKPSLGDKGYVGTVVSTPPKSNSKSKDTCWSSYFSDARKIVETTFSSLVRYHSVRSVQLNSFNAWATRINLKIAAHNLMILFMKGIL